MGTHFHHLGSHSLNWSFGFFDSEGDRLREKNCLSLMLKTHLFWALLYIKWILLAFTIMVVTIVLTYINKKC